MLGIQVISTLRDFYGRNGAETVLEICGARVALAAPDQEAGRWSVESLSRGEVTEYAQGLSYGACGDKEGKTPWDCAKENAALKGTKYYWRMNDAWF